MAARASARGNSLPRSYAVRTSLVRGMPVSQVRSSWARSVRRTVILGCRHILAARGSTTWTGLSRASSSTPHRYAALSPLIADRRGSFTAAASHHIR